MEETEAWVSDGGEGFSIDLEEMENENLISINTRTLKKAFSMELIRLPGPRKGLRSSMIMWQLRFSVT